MSAMVKEPPTLKMVLPVFKLQALCISLLLHHPQRTKKCLTNIEEPNDGKVQDLMFEERIIRNVKEDHQKLQEDNIKSHSTANYPFLMKTMM